mmetsp:Transcript_90291/g.279322  ORF Transcript_90291/g.279322 Transcript_90291/m.279322 type:complete len:252 (-) Transcript_90291:1087-1842(-)
MNACMEGEGAWPLHLPLLQPSVAAGGVAPRRGVSPHRIAAACGVATGGNGGRALRGGLRDAGEDAPRVGLDLGCHQAGTGAPRLGRTMGLHVGHGHAVAAALREARDLGQVVARLQTGRALLPRQGSVSELLSRNEIALVRLQHDVVRAVRGRGLRGTIVIALHVLQGLHDDLSVLDVPAHVRGRSLRWRAAGEDRADRFLVAVLLEGPDLQAADSVDPEAGAVLCHLVEDGCLGLHDSLCPRIVSLELDP